MNHIGAGNQDGASTRIANGAAGNKPLNGAGHQLLYRKSPLPLHSNTSNHQHQHQHTFDTSASNSVSFSYTSEDADEPTNYSLEEEQDIGELSAKFELLQRQVEVLKSNQCSQDERYKRSRQENDVLLNKVHILEDQVRELELSAETRARDDEKRLKEAMAKQVKMQSQECEQHLHANFLLQQDLFKLKDDLHKSETLIQALRSEKEALRGELHEKNSELTSLDEEIHRLKLLVKNLKDEENVKSNLISLLNEELEDSQNRSQKEQFNNSFAHNATSSSSPSTANRNNNNNHSPKYRTSSSRRSSFVSNVGDDESFSPNASANATSKALKDIDGLELSLARFKEENKTLKDMNEELQAQLLNFQLEEGRSLVQEGNKSYSLADEIGDIDVQRLMKALKEQQDDNARLRKYMDEILLKIVEKNPEILDRTL